MTPPPTGGLIAGAAEPDALAHGSAAALDRLYRESAGWLAAFLARRTGDRAEAEDLVQESFARLAKADAAAPGRLTRPQAYLTAIAKHLLADRAAAASRRPVVAEPDDFAPAALDQQQLLEARDMLRRLEAAMLALKPRRRAIFIAHRLDGLSYAEIAGREGLSLKRVEKEMGKAIADIDRLLERG